MCAFLLDSNPHSVVQNCTALETIAKTRAHVVCCVLAACVGVDVLCNVLLAEQRVLPPRPARLPRFSCWGV